MSDLTTKDNSLKEEHVAMLVNNSLIAHSTGPDDTLHDYLKRGDLKGFARIVEEREAEIDPRSVAGILFKQGDLSTYAMVRKAGATNQNLGITHSFCDLPLGAKAGGHSVAAPTGKGEIAIS